MQSYSHTVLRTLYKVVYQLKALIINHRENIFIHLRDERQKKKTNKISQSRSLNEICHKYKCTTLLQYCVRIHNEVFTVEIIKYLYHSGSACVYDFASDTIYKLYTYDTIFLFHAFLFFPLHAHVLVIARQIKKTKLKLRRQKRTIFFRRKNRILAKVLDTEYCKRNVLGELPLFFNVLLH